MATQTNTSYALIEENFSPRASYAPLSRKGETPSAPKDGQSISGIAAASGNGQRKTCEIIVQKSSPEENLGVDLRHVRGTLQVMEVFTGGAIWRSNANRTSSFQGECLKVGDCILRVNDEEGSALQMIDELRLRDTLHLLIA